ncbi:MAG: YdbL family protein [Candidatus Hydrogenedens sp.]|nr:YdbL family protein [Candidatus Hydrogenedens sp.]
MKKSVVVLGAIVLSFALGCVIRTEHKINAHITLDIRHIADQATGVLDYVEGKSDTLPGMEDVSEPLSFWKDKMPSFRLCEPVHADTLSQTDSPLVREIAGKMRQRNSTIAALKKEGCLGENNRGYVELRDCEAVSDPEKKNETQKILAEENKDRKALYAEIARLNRDVPGVNVSKVESIYALERLRRAQSGEALQLPAADADFNAVKESALGKALGTACQPGAWVTVP